MKVLFAVIFLISSILLHSQSKDIYHLSDSIIVIGERLTEDNIGTQKIDLQEMRMIGFVNYDLMQYLKTIGISSMNDLNTLPNIEGSDFNEEQFFINDIPVPFQSRLIGLQSGINSLLFSQISSLETNSINTFSKPIKLQIRSKDIDTSEVHLTSNINFLHLENVISFPVNSLNGGVAIGYNRSLLESVKPFLNTFIKRNDLAYKQFPFFQGLQFLSNFKTNDVIISPIFIYSEDNGIAGISSKEFNFHSRQLNCGVDIQTKLSKINQSIQFYYNYGRNNVDYKFFETKEGDVDGAANLFFNEFGINSSSKYKIAPNHNLDLAFSLRHQITNSENTVSLNSTNKVSSYSSEYIKTKIYYSSLLTNKILSTLNIGLSSFRINNILPSVGIDLNYFNAPIFDARFQFNYEISNEPINPIYYSFQNIIWDPSSTSSLFFIDDSKLPLKPIECLNASVILKKHLINSFIESNLSLKIFFRQLKNLIYANSYPGEVTIYNSDLNFRQDFNGIRYGLTLLLDNKINSIPLRNITSVNFLKSITYDKKNNHTFNSLNYSPVLISNFTQYQISRFYINLLFIYNIGRYLFNKSINSYYSSVDSTYNYSISTDYNSQLILQTYFRSDISFFYNIYDSDFKLSTGVSVLNIFNNKNESQRNFSLDLLNKSIVANSEYFNLPRIIVFEISMSLIL